MLRNAKKKPLTMDYVGRTVSSIAAGASSTPALYGFVLLLMSGQTWRMLIFLPFTLVSGTLAWPRIERLLRELARLGLT